MVKKTDLPIRWDIEARDSLDGIYDYIAEDSISAARHVKKTLIELARSLGDIPEKYSREEYLAHEPENYRSVAKWSYKIIFEVTEDYIIITDIFHTKQHPSKISNSKR